MDPNDEIVISGIAGRYPNCDSFDEFKDALLNGIDMVTEDDRRFPPGIYGTPRRSGKINGIEYFDAGYFGVSPRQAELMDPRHRIMFETAFEAIVDSGYNPKELRGSNTGVYVGIGGLDNSQAYKDLEKTNGYTIIGMCLGQIANRTSYSFDFKGPSYVLDTACSSGLYAFTNAVEAMESGRIEAAIVSAVQINMHPHETREFNLLSMLSAEGKCKVFCTDRDGYARSEAIITLLLQKKSVARRIYSTVLGAAINSDGFKVEGITFPAKEMQTYLIKTLYEKKKLNPNDVAYVEMHGTGTPAGDEAECHSVLDCFCQNREEPLPVGAIKSNMGHSEVSSGLCSLSKVLVATETGIIPANLHCEKLDYNLPGLKNGKLKVVTENLPWNGGIVSLNCFGFGGANAHLILKSNPQAKRELPKVTHRLVNVSGRTEESVKYYLKKVQENKDDAEFLALVDEIHKINVDGHFHRGYAVLSDNPVQEINRNNKEKRPIWFIYSGMGSQWTSMGKDLMKIDVFRDTFKRCASALQPYNIDLEEIVLSDDPAIFDDITNCFAAIAATEIALTEVLRSFGIEPDGFAGHSLGEVGCAYCNGDLTPEQAALVGYARGYASVRSKCAPGQMAAIGLSKEECLKWLPEGVYIACVNSSTSVTISGPEKLVEKFVNVLSEKGIFARLVKTAGYPFHTKYLHDSGPILKDFVSKVIKDPKPRSVKWISTSWDESESNNPASELNSAEYHRHNYENAVLFNQVYKHIPKDAIIIEVAPHGMLTSILKKEIGPDATYLTLADRNSKDNVQFLLSNIGRLFINGGQPNLRKYYSNIMFPVGRGTQNIGSLIKWDHSIKWFTPYFEANRTFGKKITVNTNEDEYNYLCGHNIDGRILMAATGYLELVWKTVADMTATTITNLPIVFESVKFLRATVLPEGQDVVFWINIMKQSGTFEVFEGGSVCCSGTVKVPKKVTEEFVNPTIYPVDVNGYIPLKKTDVYKLFHLKRYLYTGLFQGIEMVDVCGSAGKLKWNRNFTCFLDNMLQLCLISKTSTNLFLPTRLQKLVIDPIQHLDEAHKGNEVLDVYYDKDVKLIKSGGIEITNMETSVAPKRQNIQDEPILESHIFVPYETTNLHQEINLNLSLKIILQIIIENNSQVNNLRAIEIGNNKNAIKDTILKIIEEEPVLNIEFVDTKSFNLDVIVASNDLDKSDMEKLNKDGFILFYGEKTKVIEMGISIIYENSYSGRGIYLLRNVTKAMTYTAVNVRNTDFAWLDKVKKAIEQQKEVVYLFSQDNDICGIMGLVKCLNMEPSNSTTFKCVFINDEDAERFTFDSDYYKDQLLKKLSINVLKRGVWGSYRHLPVNKMNDVNVTHACNIIQTIGDLSSFKWVERPAYYNTTSSKSEFVFVYYSALNFKDVMLSTGKLHSDENYDPSAPELNIGFEYSGVTKHGKRVMGISNMPALALQVLSDPLFTWDVPNSWTMEEAATVPVVYATCYYAMIQRAQMQKNESILIHAGTGGIGMAAISIALDMKCQVFTTVGSEEKRNFLLKMFPKLKRENIGNSRNASFEHMVMKATKGKGVDIVLNFLSAELFQASIRCVAQRGRFVEIGKVDLLAGTPVSASLFAKNASFHGVLLDDLFYDDNCIKQELYSIVAKGIAKGVVRPLPYTVFAENEVENAYRFLSTGKHRGKVIIKIRDENPKTIISPERNIPALPKIFFNPEKTYILIGGLGGFGLELADFLIKRCAKKIVLNSRRGVWNGYQSLCLKKWSGIKEITVKINNENSSTIEGAEALVDFTEEMGPVGGVFNMALILQDALFINQTPEKFDAVFESKIYSGLNMDQVTRKRCPKLDHFIVFSSAAAGRGNAGQSNYGMANSALERLCETRKDDGLPGLAIQYGPVGEVGAVAEGNKFDRNLHVVGLVPQTIASCLSVLEIFMLQPCTVGSTFVLNKQTAASSSSGKSIAETVAHILGIRDIENVDKNLSLVQIGLDSLMAAEIKQTFYRNFNIELTVEEIRELTFSKIATMNSSLEGSAKPDKVIVENGVQNRCNELVISNAILRHQSVVEIMNNKIYSSNIFFLHPIEGHVDIMISLGKKLKANVYGLQCTKDMDVDNLKDYASLFIKEVKNIQHQRPFVLCGYSFGGSVAFEMALQLEKENEKVLLILIDGTPYYVKTVLSSLFSKYESEAISRNMALREFVNTFSEVDHEKANAIFDDKICEKDQTNDVCKFIADSTTYNFEEIATSADRYWKRVAAGFLYEPLQKFRGQAILFRSDDQFLDLPKDYNLQMICTARINVEHLHGNHRTMLLGDNQLRIAEWINSNILTISDKV